jgi:hypothetical protein
MKPSKRVKKCVRCNGDVVLNHALGKEFYYCRACKDEVSFYETTEEEKKEEKKDTHLPYFLNNKPTKNKLGTYVAPIDLADTCPGCGKSAWEDCATDCSYQHSLEELEDDLQLSFSFMTTAGSTATLEELEEMQADVRKKWLEMKLWH